MSSKQNKTKTTYLFRPKTSKLIHMMINRNTNRVKLVMKKLKRATNTTTTTKTKTKLDHQSMLI